ncbi:MAG: hypothetical protein AAGF11_23380 [Myxococcota bacterium]
MLIGSATATGCVREPEPCLLELAEGDLVLTELRGPQQGPDSRGEWFEIYNATDDNLDLLGLRGVLTSLRGTQQRDFLVRESLVVTPGQYVVLGSLPLDPSVRPEIDYSFNADFRQDPSFEDTDGLVLPDDADADPMELFSSARVELRACGQVIDSFVYADLPVEGTYGFDGAMMPDAEANDVATRWCVDDTPPPTEGPQTALGLPGSPGEVNRPCG